MSKFELGERVVVSAKYDCAEVGQTVTIIRVPHEDEYETCYGVCFDSPRNYAHSHVLGKYENREYWIPERCMISLSKVKPGNVKCRKCGNVVPIFTTVKSQNGDYYCKDCSFIKSYSTKNDERVHKGTKKHKTYGFELESVKKSEEEYLNMLHEKYHLIPTYDASLPDNGVEFKTPTYRSLIGLEKTFNQFYKWVDFSDSHCGQHINIGDEVYINGETMRLIRRHADRLFDGLGEYMAEHDEATKKVCGRFFTGYANRDEPYTAHSCWINLSHQDRIEFRLSKFVTPRQYILLTKMWEEMLDCVIDNYVKKYNFVNNGENRRKAKEVGDKLVVIFQKYENLVSAK